MTHRRAGALSLVHCSGHSTWRGAGCEWMGVKQLLKALMFAEDGDDNKMVMVLLGEAYTYTVNTMHQSAHLQHNS